MSQSLDDDLPFDVTIDMEALAVSRPRTRGRAARPLAGEFSRELGEADIAALGTTERGTTAPPIKELRERHHSIARLLAAGHKPGEVSAITGYSLSRVSILTRDPQFMELMEFYRSQGTERLAELRDRMTTMSLDALNELQTRLEESPDDFTNASLLEITKVLADRTGHAPKTTGDTNTQININTTERMEKAAARLAARTPMQLTVDIGDL